MYFSSHDLGLVTKCVFTYCCLVSDGDLYTGTVADFSGMDPIIYREPLQTEQYDSMSLNGTSQFCQVYKIMLSQCEEVLYCQGLLWKVSLITALRSMLTVRFFRQREPI